MRVLARLERLAMSPGTAHKLFTMLTQTDVRHVLPAIRVPTLVLHRVGDQPVRVGHARYIAEHIQGANRITSYNVCYTKLLRVSRTSVR